MPRMIDVVEFLDNSGREIVHREPPDGPGDFRLGSQVIVREGQVAVFFRDGRALDVLPPGRHTISTMNIPILAGLINLGTRGNTPFPVEVIFVSTRQFVDQKWGTPEPLAFRDPTFGMARLRSFGTYTYQLEDPGRFVTQIVGQQGIYTTDMLQNYLRGIIVQHFVDVLGTQQRSLLDLPGQYDELATATRTALGRDFALNGLTLLAFYINAITPTEDTARAIDERASMGAIGDMESYLKFKAARAMGDAATNPAGGASEGVGLGAGIGLGASVAGMLGQALQHNQPAQEAAPPPATPPTEPAAAAGGPLTRAQIQEAIDALDLRFSKGEISEDTYNRMIQRWEARLKELGG
ncbi:MAG TPA: SPFH domain-containing protein [Chloroflexota bacterium]|nr:SPFH domain-containing protein [Chloroflexota bacterium]